MGVKVCYRDVTWVLQWCSPVMFKDVKLSHIGTGLLLGCYRDVTWVLQKVF